jgi:pyridinium-3,5-biscarboxylic acid mononucleotide synthase
VSRDPLLALLERVAAGHASPAEALRSLAWLPIEPVSNGGGAAATFARVDHHRTLRNGIPEVVFGQGKTSAQVVEICRRLSERDGGFLATRVDAPTRQALLDAFPDAQASELARTVHLRRPAPSATATTGPVLIASAGTADLPVAEEAAVTLDALGIDAERLYDVGVAGLHRLLGATDVLERAAVVIVVAGMEGALPSVLGGLVRAPVIAVPTSVGYGASFGGLAALLAMLNSCAAGVTVVNVDNGFGAACAAARMLQLSARSR